MRGDGHAVWSLGLRDNVSKLIRPFRLEHFGFKPCAFLAEAFTLIGFGIDETDLNEIGFRPMRALGIEVPRRIWRVFAFAVNREHFLQTTGGSFNRKPSR